MVEFLSICTNRYKIVGSTCIAKYNANNLVKTRPFKVNWVSGQ